MLAFSGVIGLKTGMFQKIYIVFDSKDLMERDKSDFKDL